MTAVRQVGTDRILEFEFSEGRYHLFLEFYAAGNIVLTDNEYKVIALQRNVHEGAEHEQIRMGSQYDLSKRQNVNGIPPLNAERVIDGLRAFIDRQAVAGGQTKRAKKKEGDNLRKALAGSITEFPPIFLDHALRVKGFDVRVPPDEVIKDKSLIDRILESIQEAQKITSDILNTDKPLGYIIGRPMKTSTLESNDTKEGESGSSPSQLLYYDFHPFRPKQAESDPDAVVLGFEGFNRTVDEFFSSIEGQKLESRLQEKEEIARRKLEHAKQDQEKRIGGLQQVQEINVRKAQAIEANLDRVKEVVAAVNGLIAQGMDWVGIDKLIEIEKNRGNPVAEIIKLPLKLQENTVTLMLAEWKFEKDEGSGDSTDSEPSESEDEVYEGKSSSKMNKPLENLERRENQLNVDINLALSAWSNAREYYDQKKYAAAKEGKTLQAADRALKSQRQKVEADLKHALNQEKQVLRPVRQLFWFEKFIWFLSSDGYLVVGGRDAQQRDTLYLRYLKNGDVFVHADLEGAMPFIIKNRTGMTDAPIPPTTLSQAGNLSVSTSSAWESKAVMSAWWVKAESVTKKAETGDYLRPGNFAIKSQKNFLPPAQLLLGLAILFQISEDSKARHMKHRVQEDGIDKQVLPEIDTASMGENEVEEEENENDALSELDDDLDDIHKHESDSTIEEKEANTRVNPLQSNSAIANTQSLQTSNSHHAEDPGEPGFDDRSEDNLRNQEDSDQSAPENNKPKNPQRYSSEAFNTTESSDAPTPPPTVGPSTPSTKPIQISHGVSHQGESRPNTETKPFPIRGKKGKRKKIAEKYANQDEEDRAAAMRLLGSAAGQEKQRAEAATKKAREKEFEMLRQRRREQHERAQKKEVERERRIAMEEEEGGEGDGEGQGGKDVNLETMVGTPLPGDELLLAVPVCAPWSALGKYKYKAKLQPGTTKKGKAVREILGKWTADAQDKKKVDASASDVEKIWPREAELMKSWNEPEVFGVVPVGKMRVMMAGASGKGGKDVRKGGGGKDSKKAGKSAKGSKKK